MSNSFKIKILGFVATLIGAGAQVLSQYVEDAKIEEKVAEEVEKALADEKEAQ